MSISAAAEPAAKTQTLTERLNEALASQPAESPLDYRDTCDNCSTPASAVFEFPVAEILLCGHHTRLHLESLMANNPTCFWVRPEELWNLNGIQSAVQA
ncbi:DUF7455 domain-containing protein [Arthrobacter caoxuetaonis]|uniref:DUF7455 domain-containing protein n=1 Tax=Arthrobacter caoxuetaonis TaxID=2886935 RepID=A0A9X1MGP9_9MICC|nr:hypothetical protein [Arthrobacter caoxuetaonis]MCC3299808.1 hypothetical protein [Arthrobacter caoxuetaonis]USQ59292.1 hypothetical protein NF551_17050 [Arthrobacter caoxuetaonis]